MSSEASTRAHTGPVPFASHPVHKTGSWDGDGARSRLRKHASSDGSGDWDKVNRAEYAAGFAYVAGDGEKPSDYKLPHHDVVGGKLVTSPAGVEAAIGAASGARGGADIPDSDMAAVRAHLGKESEHALDRPAPWYRKELAAGPYAAFLELQGQADALVQLQQVSADLSLLDASDMPMPLLPRIGGEPPKRLLAFKWGANPTTKGTLHLTPEGAQRFMAAYAARGVRLCFDYYHASYNPAVAPSERKAAGTCVPSLNADGLWYEDINWTPPAAKAIRDGEWPYFSPAVLHDKAGVIVELKNPGLVIDPGTVNARPVVLDHTTRKGEPMADKKRLTLDAYSSGQSFLRACQAMADTDGAEKELGNRMTGMAAEMLSTMAGHMKQAGYMSEGEAEAGASKSKRDRVADRMLATLESQLGETDPERLEGRVMARLMAPVAAAAPTASEDRTAKIMLLDAYANRYPAAKRGELEALSLTALAACLQGLAEITTTAVVREAAQVAPTVEQLQKDLAKMPSPAAPAAASSTQPTTLAACDEKQRARVKLYIDTERKAFAAAGVPFNEACATQEGLMLLSDALPDDSTQIRHNPLPFAATYQE